MENMSNKMDKIRCQDCSKRLEPTEKTCIRCSGPSAVICGECNGVKSTDNFNFRSTICNCNKR